MLSISHVTLCHIINDSILPFSPNLRSLKLIDEGLARLSSGLLPMKQESSFLSSCSFSSSTEVRSKFKSEVNEFNSELSEVFGSEGEEKGLGRHGTKWHSRTEQTEGAPTLTHVDRLGKTKMVDIGWKNDTDRSATAVARVFLGPEAFPLVAMNQLKKGDVLTVAQLAGIMGAKQTPNIIPLCHPLLLSHVDVALKLDEDVQAVDITATATTKGPTGVEMEALTAVAVAALTVYDMTKAASKNIEIAYIRLLRKSGGKNGAWERE